VFEKVLFLATGVLVGETLYQLCLIKVANNEIAMTKRETLLNKDLLELFLACSLSDSVGFGQNTFTVVSESNWEGMM